MLPPASQQFPRFDSSPIISRAMSSDSSLTEPAAGDLTVNGIRLHYLDWGGDGPPIVILHATGFLGRIYRPIAEALRSIGYVYSYDQRGHGDSDHPALDAIGWDYSADDLEGFLSEMGLKEARALGHSAGATAIAAVASRRPDLIVRAVLVEPVIVDPADPPDRPNDLYSRTLKRKSVFDSVAAMYRNFENKPPYNTWRKEILHDYCEFGTRPDAHGRRVLKCPPEIEARIYGTARDFDGFAPMQRCPVPLLLIFGEKTDSPGIALKDRIAAAAPHRRVVVVPDTTHFLPMERPEETARIARQFLGGE
jgi:pimeloyl-ACP methyl ester carboxylesterase